MKIIRKLVEILEGEPEEIRQITQLGQMAADLPASSSSRWQDRSGAGVPHTADLRQVAASPATTGDGYLARCSYSRCGQLQLVIDAYELIHRAVLCSRCEIGRLQLSDHRIGLDLMRRPS